APVLRADEIDVPADFDALAKAGSMLGSAGIVVMDEMTCMVRALEVIADFYADESCGQCTPCREGAPWLLEMVQEILHGRADPSYPDLMLQVAQNILGRTICALGDAAALPVLSFVRKFRSEFDYHIERRRCDVEERYGQISNPG
ncbi:MAG: NADH-quinone oxidoreductase subunit F, partial [Acidobacteria bacterium]|nr:NADH-quinone oxidoreductase subunit F [Acidobacteriota bacterium]MDW7984509.1 NADH-ubiquinone oxidoreductase-F iron-sulfur binding region domain-containing protein [Acidobacteriota bacterium]